MSTRETLIEQLTRLSASERLEVVDRILASLDESDPALDRAWAREAGERLQAYRRGEIATIPLAEVLAAYGHALPHSPAIALSGFSARSNSS